MAIKPTSTKRKKAISEVAIGRAIDSIALSMAKEALKTISSARKIKLSELMS